MRVSRVIRMEKISINHILIACFLFISVVPLMTISLVTYYKSKDIINKNSAQYVVQMLEQANGKIELKLQQTSGNVSVLIDPVVQKGLNKYNSFNLPYQEKKELWQVVLHFMRMTGAINSTLYAVDGNAVVYNTDQPIIQYLDPALKAEIERLGGRAFWHYGGDMYLNPSKPLVRSTRLIQNMNGPNMNPIGYFSYTIPEETIYKPIEDIQLGKTGKTMIVDSLGSVVTSQNREMIGKKLDPALLDLLINRDRGTVQQEIEGKPYFIAFYTSTITQWKTIGLIPLDEMTPGLKDVQKSNMVFLFVLILLSVLLSFIINHGVSSPLRKLVKVMRSVELGKFTTSLQLKNNKEVYELSNRFNLMVIRLEQLIQQIYEKELKEKQAELKALHSQINSHFLYNTLDTIYWMLFIKGEEKAANLVVSMSRMLRYSISKGDQRVTLQDELDNVRHYIDIQSARYGDKLQVSFDIEPMEEKPKVLKLMLQPILENAISHGIEPLDRTGIIEIRTYREEGDLVILVSDNGMGIPAERLQQYEESGQIGNGLGLQNVNDRIRYTFGAPYGIRIESVEMAGTVVSVRLPLLID